MSGRKRCVFCTAAAMGISLVFGSAAMAQETTIAFPYEQDTAWDEIALTNDDTVSTGVNIRMQASEDSPVIGCLYHGGAAWIISRGEEWTEIYSGGLTGFVKNEYLVCGADAKAAARDHGVEGVATTWDDVKLYSGADGGSDVLDSIEYGDSFILTQDEGNWLQVQSGADSTAYVSAEDVSRVLLFDTAVATDESYVTPEDGGEAYTDDSYDGGTYDDGYADDSYTDYSYADETYTNGGYTDDSYDDGTYDDGYTDDGCTDDSYTDGMYTDDSCTDDSYVDETYTESGYTDDSYVDETYTDGGYAADSSADAAYTDGSYTPGTGSESYYDAATGIYYDADTGLYYDSGTGILYDAWWNPVNADIAVPMTTESYDDGSNYQDDYSDGSSDYQDDYSDGGSDDSQTYSAGSDDTSLLAALIYCEAGNQSYDGMVAVGAVVMNRVNSPLFPNTISEVIYQSGQFTPASSGWLASALESGVPSTCYDAAAAAINGENPIGSALYFNTGSGKGVKLGDHQFY